MALSMIPNPKKTVVIDFSIAEIKQAIVKIPSQFDKNYTLDKQNDLLNQFTFSATEFLSLGVYVDINLNYVTETKTSIEIEVRRKIGAFDQTFEVQKANQHIQKLFTGISTLLTKQKQIEVPFKTIDVFSKSSGDKNLNMDYAIGYKGSYESNSIKHIIYVVHLINGKCGVQIIMDMTESVFNNYVNEFISTIRSIKKK